MKSRFKNPPNSPRRDATFNDYWSFFVERIKTSNALPTCPEGHVLTHDEVLHQWNQHEQQDTITWLGHAVFLIRLGGKRFLTDPYLSKTAGPGPFGPKRYATPAIELSDLLPLDAILITHNHYDHLDTTTLRKFAAMADIPIIAAEGLTPILKRQGFHTITELPWNTIHKVGAVTITSTPAIHWSKRGLNDENRTHWCGYLFETESFRLYFSGDTAYGPIFKELGEQLGEIDFGILPIGAYVPASIMKPVHTTPEEAIQIALDTHCKTVIPMHWGTVVLSDEDPWEPPKRFADAATQNGYTPNTARPMNIGQTLPLPMN